MARVPRGAFAQAVRATSTMGCVLTSPAGSLCVHRKNTSAQSQILRPCRSASSLCNCAAGTCAEPVRAPLTGRSVPLQLRSQVAVIIHRRCASFVVFLTLPAFLRKIKLPQFPSSSPSRPQSSSHRQVAVNSVARSRFGGRLLLEGFTIPRSCKCRNCTAQAGRWPCCRESDARQVVSRAKRPHSRPSLRPAGACHPLVLGRGARGRPSTSPQERTRRRTILQS